MAEQAAASLGAAYSLGKTMPIKPPRWTASAIAALAALGLSVPAPAAMIVNPNGSVTVSGQAGGSVTVILGGNSDGRDVPGLTSELTLTFAKVVGGLYTFNYVLANTSTAPTTASRLNGFAFNTSADITRNGASITGQVIDQALLGGRMPNGIGSRDVCFSTHNCTGGKGEGLTIGQSTSGSFSLNFGTSAPSTLVFDAFAVRYQAINAQGFKKDSSGTGQFTGVVTPVPEPGTWALMLLGFGAIGYSLRRRRRIVPLLQVA